jgi:hypothetical protein
VSLAVAIVLGAASLSDIALLAHQEPVFGHAPGDTTVRRTLELADPRTLTSHLALPAGAYCGWVITGLPGRYRPAGALGGRPGSAQ